MKSYHLVDGDTGKILATYTTQEEAIENWDGFERQGYNVHLEEESNDDE